MSIIDKLAFSLGRRDEQPNKDLAERIAASNNKRAVAELIEHLRNKNKNIQSDCIKVLDEIGKLKPKLVAPYIKDLVSLLDDKNNRLQWGAMAALDSITQENPKAIYNALPKIIAVADAGTVITNDHCVGILVKLCTQKEYVESVFPLLNERILKCPENQWPTYAERAMTVVDETHKPLLIKTITSRFDEIESETKRKRVEKVLKKLTAKK